jgi:hypothetical protein
MKKDILILKRKKEIDIKVEEEKNESFGCFKKIKKRDKDLIFNKNI